MQPAVEREPEFAVMGWHWKMHGVKKEDLIGQGGAYVNNMPWRDNAAKVSLDQALSDGRYFCEPGNFSFLFLFLS